VSGELPRWVTLWRKLPGGRRVEVVYLVRAMPGWVIVNTHRDAPESIRLEWVPVEQIEKLGDP